MDRWPPRVFLRISEVWAEHVASMSLARRHTGLKVLLPAKSCNLSCSCQVWPVTVPLRPISLVDNKSAWVHLQEPLRLAARHMQHFVSAGWPFLQRFACFANPSIWKKKKLLCTFSIRSSELGKNFQRPFWSFMTQEQITSILFIQRELFLCISEKAVRFLLKQLLRFPVVTASRGKLTCICYISSPGLGHTFAPVLLCVPEQVYVLSRFLSEPNAGGLVWQKVMASDRQMLPCR